MARKKRSVHKKATGTTGFTVDEIEEEFIAEAITDLQMGQDIERKHCSPLRNKVARLSRQDLGA